MLADPVALPCLVLLLTSTRSHIRTHTHELREWTEGKERQGVVTAAWLAGLWYCIKVRDVE